MKVYIDALKIDGMIKSLYVCHGCEADANSEDEIILTDEDIDYKWIEHIVLTAQNRENGAITADKEQRFYLLLYLFFSLQRYVFFSDVIQVYTQLSNIPHVLDLQSYLWKQLEDFMKRNGYRYRVLKQYPYLYRSKIRVPLENYRLSELFSLSGIKLLYHTVKYYFYYLAFTCCGMVGKIVSYRYVQMKMENTFANCIRLTPQSNSGCLFFKVMLDGKKEGFVKASSFWGSDIRDEYHACQFIWERSKCRELYLLPNMSLSSEKCLVYPYSDQEDLLSLLKRRSLTMEEAECLLDFALRSIKDLSAADIIHRDIHPANILVKMDDNNRVTGFVLADFGCAVLNRKSDNRTLVGRRKNMNAGSSFRYSVKRWNDAASMAYVLIQAVGWDLLADNEKYQEIIELIDDYSYE